MASGRIYEVGAGSLGLERAEPVLKSLRRETGQSQAAVHNKSITTSWNALTIIDPLLARVTNTFSLNHSVCPCQKCCPDEMPIPCHTKTPCPNQPQAKPCTHSATSSTIQP